MLPQALRKPGLGNDLQKHVAGVRSVPSQRLLANDHNGPAGTTS